jgi:prophage regulatory protein
MPKKSQVNTRPDKASASSEQLAGTLPATGFVRLAQIIGSPKAGIPPIIPISKSQLWLRVAAGTFPKPLKLGPNTTAWRAEDIRSFISGTR